MSYASPELAHVAPALSEALRSSGFTLEGIVELLGPGATAAWRRGEPAAVRRKAIAAGADNALGTLIRAFILKDPLEVEELENTLGTVSVGQLVDAGVMELVDGQGIVKLDILPHQIGDAEHYVFSDVDASMVQHIPGPDHVLGLGSASMSLLSVTPMSPVDSVLDLGTGSGVQILGQLAAAERVVGTDVHGPAIDLARATIASAGASDRVELRQGSWFEPVKDETFDRIISNPPFVVGLPEVGHVYRDSGLNLDAASELVVSQSVDHLNPGGSAHFLAAWVHRKGERWQQRVASWLPDNGVAAWVLQRDVADPELYVGTWLRDESIDPRSQEGQARTTAWLDHFESEEVEGIGFGFVAIQKLDDDSPSDILIEELHHEIEGHLGDEVEEYFARIAWLRDRGTEEIAGAQFLLRPSVAIEEVSVPDTEIGVGTQKVVTRISRMDGPRWSHDIDEHIQAIVSGLHPQGLSLEETIGLYCMANDLDETEVMLPAVSAIVDLVRHGIVLPADLLADD